MSAQLSRSLRWLPEDPLTPSSCFQRLMAIQQVLKAQKISFLLRGGVRILVAMRDTDTGEKQGASFGLARARPCRIEGVCNPLRRHYFSGDWGQRTPQSPASSSWLDSRLQLQPKAVGGGGQTQGPCSVRRCGTYSPGFN